MYARINVVGLVGLLGVVIMFTNSLPPELQLPAGWWGALPMADSYVVSTYGLSAAGGLAIAGIMARWTFWLSDDAHPKTQKIVGAVAWIAATALAVAQVRWAASFGFEEYQTEYAGTHEYWLLYGAANSSCIGIVWGVWARQRVIPALLSCSLSAVIGGLAVAVLGVDSPTPLSASVPLVFGIGPLLVQVFVPLVIAGVVFAVSHVARRARHSHGVAWGALAVGLALLLVAGMIRPGAFPLGLWRIENFAGAQTNLSAVSTAPVWAPGEWLQVIAVGLMLAGPTISQTIATTAAGLDSRHRHEGLRQFLA
ncbi:hypothetical protein [Corynebacterium sp. 13CS0277]|uniref:hypothetical protein n=1 Tax=Corynebacterium sp. 13CS0277 TaxID=2071994 RepID=UPI0011B1D5B4|nr:hypothetical protein [Corynebacterium sp. 13CS0277]